jgi:hypothetical protein
MSTPVVESMESVEPVAKSSLWEDFIDIFYAPSSVFARREHASPWPPILVVSALFILISFATFNVVSPTIEAEIRRGMSANPQMTEDMMNTMVKWAMTTARWGALFTPILIFVTGLWYWLVGKPFQNHPRTVTTAVMIVAYSYIIKCVGGILGGVQALLMDPTKLTSPYALSISAARFVDRDAMSPTMYALLTKFDLFSIWYVVLLAIGLRVTGRVSRNAAILFGFVYWGLSVAWTVVSAARAAAAAGG